MKNACLSILILVPGMAFPQTLRETSLVVVKAAADREVLLYSSVDCNQCYYYLPSEFRISRKTDGRPEISLVTWNDDGTVKPAGGILHFLMEWGLPRVEEQHIQAFMRLNRDSLATIMGPVLIHAEGGEVEIQGNDKLAELLRKSITKSSSASTTPGSKMAFSFRFGENEVADILDYIANPSRSKASMGATYAYEVMTASGGAHIRHVKIQMMISELLKLLKK